MLGFAAAVLLICLYLYSVRFLDAPLGAGLRALLTVSRLVVLIFMLYLLTLPQTHEQIERAVSPTLYVLLDDSQSMAAPLDPVSDDSPSRWQTMLQSLNEDGLLQNWEAKGFPLQFALLSEASNLSLSRSAWKPGLPENVGPTLDSTDLAGAIQSFNQSTLQQQNAYLLLFTDGRWNQGGAPDAAVNQLSMIQSGMQTAPDRRVFSFGIGPVISLFDISLDRIEAPARLRAGETSALNASVSVHGELPEAPLQLRVRIVDDQANEISLIEEQINWSEGAASQQVLLALPELEAGEYTLQAEVVPTSIERIVDNNRKELPLKVRRSQDRLLLLTSAPDADFKFLKRALEDNQTIDLHAYMRHESRLVALGDRGWVQSQRGEDVEEPAQTIDEIMDSEQPWSAVVLHNFVWSSELAPFAEWLSGYIENGGGALFVPGAGNAQPAPQALEDMLPAPLAIAYNVVPAQALIEAASVQSESLRAAWQNLQGGALPPVGPLYRPSQQLLTASPLLLGAAVGNAQQPLMERHRYGLGSIVVSRAAGLWKLGLFTEQDWLTPFWTSALNESNPQLRGELGELMTDRFAYNLYDAVQVQYAAPEAVSSVTANGQFVVIQTPSKRESLWLAPTSGLSSGFEGRYTAVEAGDYVVSEPAAGVTTTFRVEAGAVETANLTQNVEGLRALAAAGGGEYANQTAWKQLSNKIPNLTRRVREDRSFFLGEKWWAAALLIAFLGFEWFLRWRQGMP
ncbi:MAG: hypothetical protein P9L94_09150 [Candidatus Hinthialibacter antarcticus]|nr:hypothetical protein [Candidatus Hinthialibacter antarcticus]